MSLAFHLSDLKRSGHREPGQSPSSYPVTVPHSVQLRRCPKPILSHTPDRLGHAVAGDDYWAYGCAFYLFIRGHQLATSLEGRDESKNKRRNHVGMVPVDRRLIKFGARG